MSSKEYNAGKVSPCRHCGEEKRLFEGAKKTSDNKWEGWIRCFRCDANAPFHVWQGTIEVNKMLNRNPNK